MGQLGGTPGVAEDRSVLTRPAAAPDAVIQYGPDEDQVADVRTGAPGAAARPLVVVLHGGFWRPEYNRAHVRPMTQALAAAGWSTVAPEYRRIPGQPDLAIDDVRAALGAVVRHPRPAHRSDGRVLLVGHSAGGHLALQAAAAAHPPAGVLALAPVADLRLAEALGLDTDAVAAFLGRPAAARPDLDPRRLPPPAARVRILHGTGDGIVPVALSESYVRRHRRADLVRVDAGHFALIDPLSAVWPWCTGALAELSGPA